MISVRTERDTYEIRFSSLAEAMRQIPAESFVFTPKYCGFDLDRAVLNKSTVGYAEAYVPTTDFYRARAGPPRPGWP